MILNVRIKKWINLRNLYWSLMDKIWLTHFFIRYVLQFVSSSLTKAIGLMIVKLRKYSALTSITSCVVRRIFYNLMLTIKTLRNSALRSTKYYQNTVILWEFLRVSIVYWQKIAKKQSTIRKLTCCVTKKFNNFHVDGLEYGKKLRKKFKLIDIIYKPIKKSKDRINFYFSRELHLAYRSTYKEGDVIKHSTAFQFYYCYNFYWKKTNILNAVAESLGSYTILITKILSALKTILFTRAICLCLPIWILRPQPQLITVLTLSKQRCLLSLAWLFLSFIQS